MIEYISSKSRLKFSSCYFPQFLPHVVLVLLKVEDVPFLSGHCRRCIHQEWASGILSRILQGLHLRYVCSPAWDRKTNLIN